MRMTTCLALASFLTACAHATSAPEPRGYGRQYQRLYSGPVLPRDQVALFAQNDFVGASAKSLDGHTFIFRYMDKGRETVSGISVFEILPGQHTVTCDYWETHVGDPKEYRSTGTQTVVFEAAAGRLYTPAADVTYDAQGKPSNWRAKVKEITTDPGFNRRLVNAIEENAAVDRAREAAAASAAPPSKASAPSPAGN